MSSLNAHTTRFVALGALMLTASASGPVFGGGADDGTIIFGPITPETAIPFEACGTLDFTNEAGVGCWIFITHTGGIYTIENVGDFEVGDPVCVEGVLGVNCYTTCGFNPTGCIFDNTITDEIDAIGTYAQGFECGVLLTDDGGSYQISGTFPDGLEHGDTIHVSGTLGTGCNAFCEMVCINGATVSPAFLGAGTLSATSGPVSCLLFSADAGGAFLLEDHGDFIAGDRVFVTGGLNQESDLCSPDVLPGIEGNTIDPVFEGCGQIEPGPQSCLTIDIMSGGGFLLSDDLQGAGMLDYVTVEGVVRSESVACWPFIGTRLELISIEPCMVGDATRDGAINVDDLVAVILAWGTDDHWADVTQNGHVDVDDLVTVITGFGRTM